MTEFFQIERIVFEKYINELSSDAFRVLLKMIYLARTTDDDVHIRSNRSLRRIVGINPTFADSVWNQLITNDLVIKKDKIYRTIYSLNGKKIRQDNAEFCEELRNFKVTIFTTNNDDVLVTDEIIEQKITQMFDKNLPEKLHKKLFILSQLVRQDDINRGNKFTAIHLKMLFIHLLKYDLLVINTVCDKYIGNPKIAGKRGYKYVIQMTHGINFKYKEIADNVEVLSTDTQKVKDEGERKFAIKIAMGTAIGSAVYEKLLANNDYEKLNELWRQGKDILTNEDKLCNLYDDYDWINHGKKF